MRRTRCIVDSANLLRNREKLQHEGVNHITLSVTLQRQQPAEGTRDTPNGSRSYPKRTFRKQPCRINNGNIQTLLVFYHVFITCMNIYFTREVVCSGENNNRGTTCRPSLSLYPWRVLPARDQRQPCVTLVNGCSELKQTQKKTRLSLESELSVARSRS